MSTGTRPSWYETFAARPIDAVVPVDYYIHGCPIHKDEFLKVVKALLLGKKPEIPTYPVCVECKRAGQRLRLRAGADLPGPGDPRRMRRLVSHLPG